MRNISCSSILFPGSMFITSTEPIPSLDIVKSGHFLNSDRTNRNDRKLPFCKHLQQLA